MYSQVTEVDQRNGYDGKNTYSVRNSKFYILGSTSVLKKTIALNLKAYL